MFKNKVILIKLVILIFCIIKYIYSPHKYINYVVLFILAYLCATFLFYIIHNKILKSIILLCVIVISLIANKNIYDIFLFLIPIVICELFSIYNKKRKYKLLSIISNYSLIYFTNIQNVSEYLLIATLCMIYYYSLEKYEIKTINLIEKVDSLKEKNYQFCNKLNENEKYKSHVIYTSQLEERNNISQEIHDKIGHTLAGSIMQLEAIKLIMKSDSKLANNMLKNVINVLRDGHESIRATLRNIKPEKQQIGVNKLQMIVEEFTSNSKLKGMFMCKGKIEKISYKCWDIIIKDTKELLTNAYKYSNGNKVIVNLEVLNKIIKVEVKDNGDEFKNIKLIKKGMGIRGIEERIEMIGGKVIIDDSNGFSVITLIPLKDILGSINVR